MLGKKLMGRAHDLASNLMQDQQHVSKMLEQASRTGDSMQLMKAMMALNDYQVRVQTVSKTVSKAASSIDQLTKLQ
jgi:predicted  nucleic acid-binding Zn-ribbon protein